MLTNKIKFLFISSILSLSYQTVIFGMKVETIDDPQLLTMFAAKPGKYELDVYSYTTSDIPYQKYSSNKQLWVTYEKNDGMLNRIKSFFKYFINSTNQYFEKTYYEKSWAIVPYCYDDYTKLIALNSLFLLYHKHLTSELPQNISYSSNQEASRSRSWSMPTLSMPTFIQEKFKTKNTILKEKLFEKLSALEQRNKENLFILDKEINELKELFKQLTLSYNYTLLDSIVYPLGKRITKEKVHELYLELSLFSHPDRFASLKNDAASENQLKIASLFKEFNNYHNEYQRPTKSLDFIVDPTIAIATNIATRLAFKTSNQIVETTCSLPSILFPDYFKNEKILDYNKEIKAAKVIINEYDTAIQHKLDTVENYGSTIKKTELQTGKTKLTNRKLLHYLTQKNKNFSTIH